MHVLNQVDVKSKIFSEFYRIGDYYHWILFYMNAYDDQTDSIIILPVIWVCKSLKLSLILIN